MCLNIVIYKLNHYNLKLKEILLMT